MNQSRVNWGEGHFPSQIWFDYLNVKENLLTPFLTITQTLTPKFLYLIISHPNLWPLTLETFLAMATQTANICARFGRNLSSKYRYALMQRFSNWDPRTKGDPRGSVRRFPKMRVSVYLALRQELTVSATQSKHVHHTSTACYPL